MHSVVITIEYEGKKSVSKVPMFKCSGGPVFLYNNQINFPVHSFCTWQKVAMHK